MVSLTRSLTSKCEQLIVEIFSNRRDLGKAAAQRVSLKIQELLSRSREISMVFAAAPSQNEFLEELSRASGIDWARVSAFHLDEYFGLPSTAPQSFGRFLRERLFEKVRPGNVYYLNGMAEDPERECRRYASFLKSRRLDIACIGVGENGHVAFNDPPVADFNDPEWVKIVDLDQTSREQQVHDGCFDRLEKVPRRAMTLTVPAILSSRFIFCMVPAPSKAEAVRKALEGPVTTDCPASILRKHQNAILFLDYDSASLIKKSAFE